MQKNKIIDASLSEIESGLTLPTGHHYKIIVHMESLEILFSIDPKSAESQDDKFILYSTDEGDSYYQEKTPNDNISENDNETLIKFTKIRKDLNYSLGVDPGKEGDPYLVFKDRSFGFWFSDPLDSTMKNEFKAQFIVNPNDENNSDYRFILLSVDNNKYKQEKTIKDDLTSNDDKVEIIFDDLDRELSYSLQVDPGNEGEPYFVFENRPYNDLSKKSGK